MKVKQKGEKIRSSYQVLNRFDFVHGVLYFTLYQSPFPEDSDNPTRFVHAIELKEEADEKLLSQLRVRNEEIFLPIQEVFIEDGVLYQVFERMEGDLLGIHVYQSAPLPLVEIGHIIESICNHLLECHDVGQFAWIDLQNMVICNRQIRFLFGGPKELLSSTELADEANLVEKIGHILYMMLTGDRLEEPLNNPASLRKLRSDVPVELEGLLMRCLSPNPVKRPSYEELWQWAHQYSGQTQERIEDETTETTKITQPPLVEEALPSKKEVLAKNSAEDQEKEQLQGEPTLTQWSLAKIKKQDNETTETTNPQRKLGPVAQFLSKNLIWVFIGLVGIFLSYQYFFAQPDVKGMLSGVIDPSVSKDEEQAQSFYQQSVKAYDSKKVDEAIELGRKALSSDTSKKEYYIHLANLYGVKKDYPKGVTTLSAAAHLFEDDANLHDALAVHHYYLKQYEEAKTAVDQAVAFNPEDASFLYHQGKIYFALNQKEEAVKMLTAAVEKNPKSVIYRYDLVQFLDEVGKLDDAIEQMKETIKLQPDDRAYRNTLGILYMKKRDRVSANKTLKDTVKSEQMENLLVLAYREFHVASDVDWSKLKKGSPDEDWLLAAEAFYYKARTNYLYDNYESAVISTQNAILIDDQEPLYYYQLGIVFIAQNNRAEAIKAFQSALDLDPKNRLYQSGLKKAEAIKDASADEAGDEQ